MQFPFLHHYNQVLSIAKPCRRTLIICILDSWSQLFPCCFSFELFSTVIFLILFKCAILHLPCDFLYQIPLSLSIRTLSLFSYMSHLFLGLMQSCHSGTPICHFHDLHLCIVFDSGFSNSYSLLSLFCCMSSSLVLHYSMLMCNQNLFSAQWVDCSVDV